MSPSQFRLLRIAGLGICLALLLLRSLLLIRGGIFLQEMSHAVWLLPMCVFIGALWANTSGIERSKTTHLVLLAIQSLSGLLMAFTMGGMHAGNYIGYLLLIVTVQLALTLPVRVVVPWIVVQTITLALAYVLADHANWITAGISVILKGFTYVIVITLKREADARAVYAALNAEMLATREFLAERSRTNERLRISRDLHDVLGHRLTGISLNLEIGLNKKTLEAGREEIEHAQSLTRNLLTEVREVVTAMRSSDRVNVNEALRGLASGFAPLIVHLDVPPQLESCDSSRAEVLIRCAQELITNAVKHARARQIWIELEFSADNVLRVCGRDDGHCTVTESPRMGFGLTSMRERFEHFGGRIQVFSDPQKGFTLTAFLPMLPAVILPAPVVSSSMQGAAA